MAIRDLWAFENGPVGLNLAAAAANFANYTGHSAGTAGGGTGTGTVEMTSDGWLSIAISDTVSAGALGFSALKSTMGFTGSSLGMWCGFRIRSTTGALNSNFTSVFSYGNGVLAASPTVQTILTAAQIVAAGGCTAANVSNYIEIFMSSTVWQVWMDGVMILSGTPTYPGNISNAWYFNFGVLGGSLAGGVNMQFRDMYFLEVLSTGGDNGRLGPIAGNVAAYESAAGTGWTLNAGSSGVTTLEGAISTPLNATATTTPNIVSPSNNAPLTVETGLPPSVSANNSILAVQLYASIAGSASNAANIQAEIEASEGNVNVGTFSAPTAAMLFNQKLPFLRNNPTGGAWSSSDISNLTSVLTPQ